MFRYAALTPETLHILRGRATEKSYTNEMAPQGQEGTYLCRGCGLALFRAQHWFDSGCGWPSFDQAIEGQVAPRPDPDGKRTEMVCGRCEGHLGHVFEGEGLTSRNIRHCANSLALEFVADATVTDTEQAVVAGGCFWGVQHNFDKLAGVLKTEAGYTGGQVDHPSYEQVCRGDTGHFEAVRIVYTPSQLNYQDVLQYFFDIHDATQAHGQGPDIGNQYRSAVFYLDEDQLATANQVIRELGYSVATQFLPAAPFWPAEAYHQHFHSKS